jgi:hypothetical protein
MKLAKLTGLFLTCLGLSVSPVEITLANTTVNSTLPPTMIVINLDKAKLNAEQLQKIDLKNTLIQITASDNDNSAPTKMSEAIHLIAAKANHSPVILGFVIISNSPLNDAAAHDLASLATKATFISTKCSLQTAKQWQLILAAEQKNTHLLSVVYGTSAIEQLQTMPEMGTQLANTGVAFIHIFDPDATSPRSAASFWQNVSQTLKVTKHAMGIIVLESGSRNKLDYDAIVTSSTDEANGYLFWLGDKSAQTFSPATLNATHFSIWRKTAHGIKSFSYERAKSPQSLYMALGITRPTYEVINLLTTRAKQVMTAGVDLMGDAETHIHTLGVLLDFANTVVSENDNLMLPPDVTAVTLSKLNLLILNPTKTAIQKISDDSMMLKESIMQEDYIGVFDYSTQYNAIFYKKLGTLLTNFPGVNIDYNTDNLSSLQAIIDIGIKSKIKTLNLGPDASALYSNKDNAPMTKMIGNLIVNLYQG